MGCNSSKLPNEQLNKRTSSVSFSSENPEIRKISGEFYPITAPYKYALSEEARHDKSVHEYENTLIRHILIDDINKFLSAKNKDQDYLSENSHLLKVGTKMCDQMSKKGPGRVSVILPSGKYRILSRPAPNTRSIPEYFHTTNGAWNTISNHLQSIKKKSDNDNLYTEENIKKFFCDLGEFVFSKICKDLKDNALSDVAPNSSIAEHYRHYVEKISAKKAQKSFSEKNINSSRNFGRGVCSK